MIKLNSISRTYPVIEKNNNIRATDSALDFFNEYNLK